MQGIEKLKKKNPAQCEELVHYGSALGLFHLKMKGVGRQSTPSAIRAVGEVGLAFWLKFIHCIYTPGTLHFKLCMLENFNYLVFCVYLSYVCFSMSGLKCRNALTFIILPGPELCEMDTGDGEDENNPTGHLTTIRENKTLLQLIVKMQCI